MLLELIAKYYNLLWVVLAAIALLKIILSYAFHGKLEGVNGMIYALFIWYSEEEQEMEEFSGRRTMMRIHNIITLLMYTVVVLIIFSSFLPRLFGR